MYNERFQGEGAPDWAVLGRAAEETPSPLAGFPNNYIVQDAVNQAYDAFWANTRVPGTHQGVQDLYAGAWAHVARRFAGKSGIVGYNLVNEPWEGALGQRGVVDHCATTPASCGVQHFESTTLTTFYRRVVKAIRKVDPGTMVYEAPTLVFDFGFRAGLDKLDRYTGFAFNAYCAQATGLDAVIPFLRRKPCSYSANLSFKNARAVSRRTGDALFMTEFGSSDNISTFTPYLALAQEAQDSRGAIPHGRIRDAYDLDLASREPASSQKPTPRSCNSHFAHAPHLCPSPSSQAADPRQRIAVGRRLK